MDENVIKAVAFNKSGNGRFTYEGCKTWFVTGDLRLKLNGVRMQEGEIYEVHNNDYIEFYATELEPCKSLS
jgi:hypothetical protein